MQVASFDNYAQAYDEHFTFSEIGKLQRKAVYSYLLPLLNQQKYILEINCGTGYDASEITKHVKSIIATDASEKMIKECEKRKTENISFKAISIQNLQEEIKQANFIFSNFGGLNCLSPEDLKKFSAKCDLLLSKNSELFFVIMGRKCIWEKMYFTLKSDPQKASRRKNKEGVNTVINDAEFKTWYYSPKEIQNMFGSNFKVNILAGIGLFVPPSYLNPFFQNKKVLLKVFNLFDKLFCNFKWTGNYADHYLIHLKKVN